jgi:ABC-type transport system involved in multi-copper enzyme maturation permease subunit
MPHALRRILELAPLNPIAVRLVQSGSRRARHGFLRSAYLAVLIGALLWLLLLNAGGANISYRQLAEAGASSFVAIAYLQIALICVLSPVFMAGAIAQEANPRTWDILLTTPLSPGQIVLGNLFGRLFFILALLLASLPLFALTQYFGGVPASSIFASYLVAAGAALVVGTSAIALSVSRLVGRRAVFTFYVAVVSYLAATAAGDVLIQQATRPGVTWLTGLNPFLALRALLNPTTYPRADAGTHTGLAWVMLENPVTAWVILSSFASVVLAAASTLTVRVGGLTAVARPGRRGRTIQDADGVTHRAPRTVWHNPIAWREAAARNATFWRVVARWVFVAAGVVFGLGLIWLYHTSVIDPRQFRAILLAAVWTEITVITLVAINASATAVSREREDGTLDLLLTTAITPTAYLNGKLRGLIAYLLPLIAVPVGTLLVAGLYFGADALGNDQGATVARVVGDAGATADFPVVLPEAGLIALLVVLPFVAFCVMIGLKWSLQSRGTIGSVVATVLAVAVVAGTIGLCGWQSGKSLAGIGPALAGLNPASAVFAVINPYAALGDTAASGPGGLTTARWSLAIGAAGSVGMHGLVVWILQTSMVRTFDMTVRRLAGTR